MAARITGHFCEFPREVSSSYDGWQLVNAERQLTRIILESDDNPLQTRRAENDLARIRQVQQSMNTRQYFVSIVTQNLPSSLAQPISAAADFTGSTVNKILRWAHLPIPPERFWTV